MIALSPHPTLCFQDIPGREIRIDGKVASATLDSIHHHASICYKPKGSSDYVRVGSAEYVPAPYEMSLAIEWHEGETVLTREANDLHLKQSIKHPEDVHVHVLMSVPGETFKIETLPDELQGHRIVINCKPDTSTKPSNQSLPTDNGESNDINYGLVSARKLKYAHESIPKLTLQGHQLIVDVLPNCFPAFGALHKKHEHVVMIDHVVKGERVKLVDWSLLAHQRNVFTLMSSTSLGGWIDIKTEASNSSVSEQLQVEFLSSDKPSPKWLRDHGPGLANAIQNAFADQFRLDPGMMYRLQDIVRVIGYRKENNAQRAYFIANFEDMEDMKNSFAVKAKWQSSIPTLQHLIKPLITPSFARMGESCVDVTFCTHLKFVIDPSKVQEIIDRKNFQPVFVASSEKPYSLTTGMLSAMDFTKNQFRKRMPSCTHVSEAIKASLPDVLPPTVAPGANGTVSGATPVAVTVNDIPPRDLLRAIEILKEKADVYRTGKDDCFKNVQKYVESLSTPIDVASEELKKKVVLPKLSVEPDNIENCYIAPGCALTVTAGALPHDKKQQNNASISVNRVDDEAINREVKIYIPESCNAIPNTRVVIQRLGYPGEPIAFFSHCKIKVRSPEFASGTITMNPPIPDMDPVASNGIFDLIAEPGYMMVQLKPTVPSQNGMFAVLQKDPSSCSDELIANKIKVDALIGRFLSEDEERRASAGNETLKNIQEFNAGDITKTKDGSKYDRNNNRRKVYFRASRFPPTCSTKVSILRTVDTLQIENQDALSKSGGSERFAVVQDGRNVDVTWTATEQFTDGLMTLSMECYTAKFDVVLQPITVPDATTRAIKGRFELPEHLDPSCGNFEITLGELIDPGATVLSSFGRASTPSLSVEVKPSTGATREVLVTATNLPSFVGGRILVRLSPIGCSPGKHEPMIMGLANREAKFSVPITTSCDVKVEAPGFSGPVFARLEKSGSDSGPAEEVSDTPQEEDDNEETTPSASLQCSTDKIKSKKSADSFEYCPIVEILLNNVCDAAAVTAAIKCPNGKPIGMEITRNKDRHMLVNIPEVYAECALTVYNGPWNTKISSLVIASRLVAEIDFGGDEGELATLKADRAKTAKDKLAEAQAEADEVQKAEAEAEAKKKAAKKKKKKEKAGNQSLHTGETEREKAKGEAILGGGAKLAAASSSSKQATARSLHSASERPLGSKSASPVFLGSRTVSARLQSSADQPTSVKGVAEGLTKQQGSSEPEIEGDLSGIGLE